MTNKRVRVRFAPSPTGGLHLGGVRTTLFNYLFAKKHCGDFIVRIEDTDQTRFVEGAEAYIFDCLAWCGIVPNESPLHGGPHAPYRQSERKPIYKQYADQLVARGHAYYAFDTAESLEEARKSIPNFQYNQQYRQQLRNSFSMKKEEVVALIENGTPYVVRINMPTNETVTFTDLIRGEVSFNTSQVDDKVLLKADGMPTYHLAVVVDDYLMQISHAFRGEEWLPSAPVHVLLWKYLFGIENMPKWAHLPLILKPDGNGKLSKRDGDRLGFPVFAMDWKDPKTGDLNTGFKEHGFLPEAFINMLAMLGWSSGTEQEIFSLAELIDIFTLEKVHKGGAKFDYEKAKWFNHEWIKQMPLPQLATALQQIFKAKGIDITDAAYFEKVIALVKERATLLPDFIPQADYFFQSPTTIDTAAIQSKWEEKKQGFFETLIENYNNADSWAAHELETIFKTLATELGIKTGDLMLPFRIMLVGGKFGPGVFDIATLLGKRATTERIAHTLQLLSS